jgi:hypothetical protein
MKSAGCRQPGKEVIFLMSTNFFSSLSGSYDYISSMSSLLSDYSTIKSGAYGSLMKSYVNKVGNKSALKAYQETGSTTTGTDSTGNISGSKKTVSKSSFLDNYFNDISKTGKSEATSKSSDTAATSNTNTSSVTDAYAKYRSSWLDDQLKQYDKEGNKTTAADTSVSYDTTI